MNYLLLFFISFVSFAQQNAHVDFIELKADVYPNAKDKSIQGKCTFEFKVKKQTDTLKIDAKSMEINQVMMNGRSVQFINNGKQLVLFEGYSTGSNTLSFTYFAQPKQTLYFVTVGNDTQIWTQGQGKYTSHWLPSFDDVNEKLIFKLTVHQSYNIDLPLANEPTILSNGILKKSTRFIQMGLGVGNVSNSFEMKQPMSSYLVMLAIGNYSKKTMTTPSGVLLENYYLSECENQYDYTYKSSEVIFNYLEKEIGMKYPWEVYRQIPVRDFLYGGMENTTSTIFAQDYFVNESGYNDRKFINVNAHELAHQWFGDVVTATEGKHHWLQEGFATYYALLAEREIFGDDYFYNALYHHSLQLRTAEKTDSIPVMNEKASSLTFYQKGAWALHVIRESIGEKKFQKAVKNYLRKYKFKNVETSHFLNEVSKVSDFDVVSFQKRWLESSRFPVEEATALLQKNTFIQQLFYIQKAKNLPQKERFSLFFEVLKSDCYYPIKVEIVNQLRSVPFEEKKALLRIALQTNQLKVRLAVAQSLKTVPVDFQTEYESLLDDLSHDTKEEALYNLFTSFPEKQKVYLEKSATWIGNNDKNLRILHLFLKELSQKGTADSLQELVNYTSNDFESSIRMNAFDYVLQLETIDDQVLIHLVQATQHFRWQVTSFARNTIRKLLKEPTFRTRFQSLKFEFSSAEKNQLQKLLDEK